MIKPLIKICGIQQAAHAREAAAAGAHFIGLVFHPDSKRFVNLAIAKEISMTAKSFGATPVAVFVNHTVFLMQEICNRTNIQVVQLHGRIAKQQHHLLPDHYQRIYVKNVLENGIVSDTEDPGLNFCDPKRDYLLFDNTQPGKGQAFNWDNFHYKSDFRYGLAGGLNPNNIHVAINQLKPDFVDTSSGVENKEGQKDISLIQKFIESVQREKSHDC